MARGMPSAQANHVAGGWPPQQPWQHRDAHVGPSASWGLHAMHAMQPAQTWASPLPGTPAHLWPAAPVHVHASPNLPLGVAPRMAAHEQAAGPGCWPAQAPQYQHPQAGAYPLQQQGHLQQPLAPSPETHLQELHQPATGFVQAAQHQQILPASVHALQQQPVHFMPQGQAQHMSQPMLDVGQLWATAVRSASVNVQPPPPPPSPPEQ